MSVSSAIPRNEASSRPHQKANESSIAGRTAVAPSSYTLSASTCSRSLTRQRRICLRNQVAFVAIVLPASRSFHLSVDARTQSASVSCRTAASGQRSRRLLGVSRRADATRPLDALAAPPQPVAPGLDLSAA